MNFEFLKHLSIPFSKVLYDGLVGTYQTKIKGQGTDYDSSRPYDTSDHPKYIDRKTTAKKDSLYSKQYHEEQQIHVCFVLDIGASMQFGFTGKTKYDVMKNISILLGSIVATNNDNCSFICYDQDIQHIQLNLTSTTIIPTIVKLLTTDNGELTTNTLHSNLASCISHLPSIITRPTHFIFITDDQDDNVLPLLRGLRKHHEVSYILIQHSLEQSGISGALVSDGMTPAHTLPHDYKKIKENKNLERSRAIKNFGGFYCSLNESSDLQKSLLSLWR